MNDNLYSVLKEIQNTLIYMEDNVNHLQDYTAAELYVFEEIVKDIERRISYITGMYLPDSMSREDILEELYIELKNIKKKEKENGTNK